MYHIKSEEGARELAAAILQSLCLDYVRVKRTSIRATSAQWRTRAAADLKFFERWFQSGYAELLCEGDPTRLMRELDEIAMRGW